MTGTAARSPWEAAADLVVVGSGVAGLTAALDAVAAGLRTVVVTKDGVDTRTRAVEVFGAPLGEFLAPLPQRQ